MKHALADALEEKMLRLFERRRPGDRSANRWYEQLVESATVLRRSALRKPRDRKK